MMAQIVLRVSRAEWRLAACAAAAIRRPEDYIVREVYRDGTTCCYVHVPVEEILEHLTTEGVPPEHEIGMIEVGADVVTIECRPIPRAQQHTGEERDTDASDPEPAEGL